MSRFDDSYESSTPPWDIGRPQPRFAALVGSDLVQSPIIDVGCGTGEHALAFAAAGHEVLGIDFAAKAIELARAKAVERGVTVQFEVADALDLSSLGRTFATALDSGVFHVFDDADRARYVDSLTRIVRPGGRYFMMVFSDREPTDWGGPRRIRREEIEQSFARGWKVESIEPAMFDTNIHPAGGHAHFAILRRQ
ncbi:MAG TPA: class I SAM-dependent methyltransferase [Nannocystaceae bacterium]|nr:class I SAM-dependent methyltransferase [Nannocystaceae bacterium]